MYVQLQVYDINNQCVVDIAIPAQDETEVENKISALKRGCEQVLSNPKMFYFSINLNERDNMIIPKATLQNAVRIMIKGV